MIPFSGYHTQEALGGDAADDHRELIRMGGQDDPRPGAGQVEEQVSDRGPGQLAAPLPFPAEPFDDEVFLPGGPGERRKLGEQRLHRSIGEWR